MKGPFAVPTITRTAMSMVGAVKPNLVARAVAVHHGSPLDNAMAALVCMANAPTMLVRVVLPALAKEINITGSVCR